MILVQAFFNTQNDFHMEKTEHQNILEDIGYCNEGYPGENATKHISDLDYGSQVWTRT